MSLNDSNSSDDEVKKIMIHNPIINFVKKITIVSPNDKINKKILWKLYNHTKLIKVDYIEFNNIIKKNLMLDDKKINYAYYWLGIKLII